MLTVFKNIWKKLQSPYSIGHVINIYKILGVYYRGRSISKSIFFYCHLGYDIAYFFSLLLNVVINFEYNLFIMFVNYSEFYMSPLKMFTYAKLHEKWESLIDDLIELEKESTSNPNAKHTEIIVRYRKYCHWIVYGFCVTCVCILLIMFYYYWIKNILIFDDSALLEPISYIFNASLPFNQNSRAGRYGSAILQTLFGFLAPTHTVCWDSLVLSTMILLAGQLRALRVRCVHALDSEHEEVCWKNLLACYHQHVAILKQVFFIYF